MNKGLLNVGTSALKVLPGEAGLVSALRLDLHLQNQIPISSISEQVILLRILKGDRVFPQSNRILLNQKILIRHVCSPPQVLKILYKIQKIRSLFPNLRVLGLC